MLRRIKAKLHDMGTIKRLCERAEAHALRDQQHRPGAEHFLLAAMDLDDGTARLAFERAGLDPNGLKQAIDDQYSDALRSIGLDVAQGDLGEEGPLQIEGGAYRAAPSGQAVMQALAATRQNHAPLLGAHIVATVAGMPQGVAARAVRSMGADLAVLRSTAETILRETRAS